ALAAALGEAVERIATTPPSRRDLLYAAHADFASEAVDPHAFDLFHPQTRAAPGFPFLPPSRLRPQPWVWGACLASGEPRAVPAGRVFVEPVPSDGLDAPLVSGFAAGDALAGAVLAGLCEVLERDHLMIAWANRLPLRRLDLGGANGDAGACAAAFADRGLEARCAAVELDLGVHLAVGMLRPLAGEKAAGEPATVISAAAGPDLHRACARALHELVTCRAFVQEALRRAGGRLPAPGAVVAGMADHGLLYARPDMLHHLDPWWHAPAVPLPPPSPPLAPAAALGRLLERLEAAGLRALVVELTPPEIRDLGLHVVKVLVPGTYPMNFDGRWPHFGGERIYRAPVACGLRSTPLSFAELNRVPHPFP
ncbi:MAG: hypothetical protein D6696_09080, partial [Acidobacteria bacterium]